MTNETLLRKLQRPDKRVRAVLDTDAYNEIDDQFAIAYMLKKTEVFDVQALTAAPFSNNRATDPGEGMKLSYDEIHKILALMDREDMKPRVFEGSMTYLPDEQTPVESPAAKELVRLSTAADNANPLYIIAIGAITNVASALLIDPTMADRCVIVWLGGNAHHWRDTGEFNMAQDVAAARVVFGSGAPLVILPCMGVVSSFTTTGPELRHWLSGKNALCDYLVQQTTDEANTYAAGRVWSRVIWDVTAIAWLLNDGDKLLLDRLIPTPIPEFDDHYGFDPRRPLCRYVYHINRDALFSDLFEKLSR